MRHVVDHIEAGNSVLVQRLHRGRFHLGKNRYQDVVAFQLFFTAGLDVQRSALQYPLKPARRYRNRVVQARHHRHILIENPLELPFDAFHVSA
jgi:hypothetical protein